jgi:hypothetical protein
MRIACAVGDGGGVTACDATGCANSRAIAHHTLFVWAMTPIS